MKINTNHEIYVLWNQYTVESVYCDFKPTDDDVADICHQVGWLNNLDDGQTNKRLEYIKVNKLTPIFSK